MGNAEAERRLREALARCEAEGTDPATCIALLLDLARVQTDQGRVDAAHATLDVALTALPQDDRPDRACYLLERGRAFLAAGEDTIARKLLTDALKLARTTGATECAAAAAALLESPAAHQADWPARAS